MEKEKNYLDDLFKKGLSAPDISFEEAHWEDMERRLVRKNRYRKIRLIALIATGCAAILALVFVVKKGVVTPPDAGKNEQMSLHEPVLSPDEAPNYGAEDEDRDLRTVRKKPTAQDDRHAGLDLPVTSKTNLSHQPVPAPSVDSTWRVSLDARLMPVHRIAINGKAEKSLPHGRTHQFSEFSETDSDPSIRKERVYNGSVNSLTLLAAPDLTRVRGASDASWSQHIGVLYTRRLTRRVSVSAGVLYARKNYTSPYALYNPKSPPKMDVMPVDVRAACDVLDVPILVNLNVLHRDGVKISVSTGLSSYFMLRERYDFSYAPVGNYGASSTKTYEIQGENKHILGVADFSLSVEKNVGKKWNVGLRPFIQVPLTGVGYGQTKLQSTGVAVTVGLKL
ncbi:hypothetical protein [Sphingobacterium suaedae]|uniref:Outer membrane protein beta-barrel domain-containing protein n=1 Tax=Sphingobacterium suaedae TaxID=1686402 RepID=A0ABW5KM49_9SPHI